MKQVLHTLLIEDSEDDAFLILLNLRKGPFDIQSRRVDNEKDLIAALYSENWDLILCDYSLPGFSGFQALSISQQSTLDIPFIFVSGSMGEDVAVDAMHKGAHDYVMKGNLKRLLPAIERELKEVEIRKAKKKAEIEINIAKNDWERTFDAIPDLIAIIDSKFKIVRANKAMSERLGISQADMQELPCYQCFHGMDHPHEYCPHFLLLQDKKEHSAELFEAKLGADFFVSTSPLYDAQGELIGSVHIARDITKEKKSQAIIRENEERYRSLFDNMLEGVAYCKLIYENGQPVDFLYLNVNKAYGKIRPLQNVTGKRISEIVPGILEKDPLLFELYDRVVKTKVPEQIEFYLNSIGEWVHISSFSAGEGEFVTIFDVITSRKQAEVALEHEQYLLRTLMDNMPDAIYFKDKQSRFIRVSRNHTSRLGIDNSEEIIGKSDFDLFSKEHAQKAFDDEQSIIRSGVPLINIEEEETFPEKESRWVLTTKLPLYDAYGTIIGTFGISKDITQRKKIELALEYEQYLMRSLMDNIPESIYFKDLQSRFVRVSYNLCIRAGMDKPEQLIGLTDFDILTHEIAQQSYTDEQNIIATGKPLINVEEEEKFPDKPSIYVLTTKLPMYDSKGNVTGTFGISRDITNNKRIEETLRESEERFKQISESAGEWIWETDATGLYTYASPAVEQILGYKPEELIGKKYFYDLFLPDEKENHREEAFKSFRNKESIKKLVNASIHKNDKIVYLETNGLPFFDKSGNFKGVRGANIDITERINAEADLKKSEDKFRLLIENQGEGVGIVDTNELFIFSNPAADQIFGVPPGGLINRNLKEFLLPAQYGLLDEESEKRSRYEKSSYEIEIITLNGIKRSILITATPQLNEEGKHTGTFGVFRDITDRKLAENDLKASEKRFRSYFEMPLIGMAISSVEKRWLECNDRLCGILGYTREEIIHMSWSEMTHPDDLLLNETKFNQVLSNEIDQYRLEKRFLRKDGSIVYTDLVAGCVRNEDGSVEYLITLLNDISERKQAENDLKISLSLLKATLESTTDGILVVNNERKITGYNSRFETIWKLPSINIEQTDDQKLVQSVMSQLIDPDTFFTKVNSLYNNPHEDSFDLLEFKDGRIIERYSIPQRLDDKIVGRVWSFRDITERKLAEEERIQSEQKYRELADFLPSAIFESNLEGQITYVNKAALEWLGYTEADLFSASTNIFELISEKDRKKAKAKIHEIISSGLISSGEYTLVRKDYSTFPTLIITRALVHNGQPFGLRGVISDLTQYIMAEKALRASEESYRRTIETSIEGILITDANGVFNYANDSLLNMLGYTMDELVGKRMEDIIHEDDVLDQIKQFEERKAGLKARYHRRFRKKDNTLLWAEISASPVLAEDGSFNGSFAMIIDITQRLMSEKEVRMHRDHLEELVNERTEELINSQEKLKKAIIAAEAANRAKSEFLANMSHEIRTPMNAIIGFSDLLFSSVKDEKQHSQVGSIRRSARSLLEIINDILDLSKIEAGKFNIQYVPVNVYKLIKDIEVIFSQRIEEKGISFILEMSSDIPPSLLLDETRLRQILFNLIGNAVKFTEKGYVKLTIYQRASLEDIKKVDLIFIVEDTGIGIPADQQSLILKPFYQQEGQSTKKYGGTGLGLAITSRLVEMMSGKILISSVPGRGSIFEISLPNIQISDDEVLHKEDISFDPATVIFKDAIVLVVDDNTENRGLIRDLLEYSAITIIEASNGEEAISMALANKPDLILMDLLMPVMNGFEATVELKKNPVTKAIPVFAISASAKSLNLEDLQKEVFSGILLKPVDLSELVDCLKQFLKYDIVISNEEHGDKIKTPLELNADQFANLPVIIAALENDFLTEFKEMMQNQLISQMEDFGRNLLVLSEKYELKPFIQFANEVCKYADNFDIGKLISTLNKFPSMVEDLKAPNN